MLDTCIDIYVFQSHNTLNYKFDTLMNFQAAAPRSKTVLLVKNLPANTDPEDLRAVFSKHGALGRVILPPSGVTAIIEYLDPTEAKLGFRNLAYTKVCKMSLVECQFQDLP